MVSASETASLTVWTSVSTVPAANRKSATAVRSNGTLSAVAGRVSSKRWVTGPSSLTRRQRIRRDTLRRVSALGDHFRGGEGEPLLLLHGYTATWRVWGPVVPRLAEDFDVLAPTIGGHTGGPRCRRATRSTWSSTGSRRCSTRPAGRPPTSRASRSAAGWRSSWPSAAAHATVTAISPGGATTERDEREARRIKALFAGSHLGAQAILPLAPELCRRPRFRHLAMRDQMVAGERDARRGLTLIDGFARTPVFWRFWREIGTPPGLEDVETVDVPVTVLWGDSDRVLPARLHAPFFRDRLPDARFETLVRAGHVPFWDATDAVVDAIVTT